MVDEITNFEAAREYLNIIVSPYMETFFPFATDPFSSFTIIRDTERLIDEEMKRRFPTIPPQILPKCKFRMHLVDEDKFGLEYNIQFFINKERTMKYLGSCAIGKESYDLYCRHSFDPNFDIMFFSKHGHGDKEISSGSRTAEAEYHLGVNSPLAVAFGMAVQDGLINIPLE